jgi:hypothetical protein
MSRHLLTFGYDACHRWSVLRLAGFTVDHSGSIQELRERLMRSHFMGSHSVEAVIMVEDIVAVPEEAIVAARSYFTGPVVLFEGRTPTSHRDRFDLRVPTLTRPEVWLPMIDTLSETIRTRPMGEVVHSKVL